MRSISGTLSILALVGMFWTFPAYGQEVTRLTIVDSSETSWVARGLQDYTVTPDGGWTFTPSRNFDDGVGFSITRSDTDAHGIDRWGLNFAAPSGEELTPGLYENFSRFPFQDSDQPGLEFSSTGRLDNTASGTFEVLEVTYGPEGEVLTFAADFIHFGETNENNFAIVEIRYNVEEADEIEVLEADVDIRPGGGPNPINLRARGVLPVAVLSTQEFDALDIDEETVLFADVTGSGLPVAPLRSTIEDVDGDGTDDLLLFFSIAEIADFEALDAESVEATLTGETFDGTPIIGMDEVRIVPQNDRRQGKKN